MVPVDFGQWSLLKFASSVLPSVTAGYFNPPRHRAHGNFSSLDNSGKSAWSDIIKTKASKAARSSVRYRADICAVGFYDLRPWQTTHSESGKVDAPSEASPRIGPMMVRRGERPTTRSPSCRGGR